MPRDDRTPDEAAIRDLLDRFRAAAHAKDAKASEALHIADPAIYSLAPPLVETWGTEGYQGWLDGWDGPVSFTFLDLEIFVSGEVGFAHGLNHTEVRRDGQDIAWWTRFTFGLRRTAQGWRIAHHHESVPFHMDGSMRAAVDLKPEDRE